MFTFQFISDVINIGLGVTAITGVGATEIIRAQITSFVNKNKPQFEAMKKMENLINTLTNSDHI